MFKNLFSPDSPLMITMTQITDCIFLSLFWLAGCFPVVTAGVSTAALYDSVYHGLRKGDRHSWQRFFTAYRRNFKSGILPGILFLILFAAGSWALIQCWNAAVYGQISWTAFSAGAFFAVYLLGILSVLFPMLSRFENSLSQLFKNTVFLSLANPVRTMLLGLTNAAAVFLCVRYIFPLLFLPGLAALISSVFIEPMFRPYMNIEDAAA